MKKLLALFLMLTMICSMAVTVSASETNQIPGSTVLTTVVPAAEYTLNIPADTTIDYGQTTTKLGNVTVTDSKNFAQGKNLKVTVTYDAFKADDTDITTTIPFVLKYSTVTAGYIDRSSSEKASGDAFVFHGRSTGELSQNAIVEDTDVTQIGIYVTSTDWGKALAGNYTAIISFSAEVVAE